MVQQLRFFYNSDAGEAGGSSEDTGGQSSSGGQQAAGQSSSGEEGSSGGDAGSAIPEEVLKELEELREFKLKNYKEPEPTDEEKQKKAEIEKAEFVKYGVESDLFKMDDLTKYEAVKVKSDSDLVFEDFLNEFKEENDDITDESELLEAAKLKFKDVYKIDSEKESVRNRALQKLSDAASKIRNGYGEKIETARARFDDEKKVREVFPVFDGFVDKVIEKVSPGGKVLYNHKFNGQDVPVEIELTQDDRKAIAEAFKSPKTFLKFNTNGEAQTETELENKISNWIKANKFDDIVSKTSEIVAGIAIKNGSTVGAENPFPLRNNASGGGGSSFKKMSIEESNERIGRARSGY